MVVNATIRARFQLIDLRKKRTEHVDRTLYGPTRPSNKTGDFTLGMLENLKAQIRHAVKDSKWFYGNVINLT